MTMEAATGVIVERGTAMRGLPRMVTVSAAAHVVLAILLIIYSAHHRPDPAAELRPVMTISLGGAPGPSAGGMTMAGRPIQATAPLADAAKPEPLQRPTARPPSMTVPDPKARTSRTPAKPAGPANEIVSKGSQPPALAGRPGQGFDSNPARGLGFGGLSTGGGGGTGGYLDVQNFCCPDYLVTMLQIIQKNWNARQEVAGESLIMFQIQRDGRLTDIELERSSGFAALDLTAQRTLFLTQRVTPLPSAFLDDHLTVHLRFQYQR
jgi:TonB family protein